MKLKGVIFDCDGVLFDSKSANIMFYNKLLNLLGLKMMNKDQEEATHMLSVIDSIKYIVPEEKLAEALSSRNQLAYEIFLPLMIPAPNLVATLKLCRNLGIKCGINTNRTNSMEMVLEHFELSDFFDPVITVRDVKTPKPSPEGLYKIINLWKCEKEEVVFVGDSSVDEQAAKNAGIEFWAYQNSNLGGKKINSFFEIATILNLHIN